MKHLIIFALFVNTTAAFAAPAAQHKCDNTSPNSDQVAAAQHYLRVVSKPEPVKQTGSNGSTKNLTNN